MTDDSGMKEPTDSVFGRAALVCFSVFALALVYAFVRYNVVRNVPYENIPLFVANKSISMTAVILIGMSFLLGHFARFFPKLFSYDKRMLKFTGVAGFFIAALHSLMSLVIFSPAYYPGLFSSNGRLNLAGESAMLFGIISLLLFSAISITSLKSVEKDMNPQQWRFIQRLGYFAYAMVLIHVAIIGWRGWWLPESWQYGLASISLISASFVLFVLVFRMVVMVLPKKP